MAYEMRIPGSEQRAKVRSPWAVALLPIVTLGIYHLVWWYRIHQEMKAFGESRGYDLGRNPLNSLLALFPGGLIVVPALISYWRGTVRVQGTEALADREPLNGWLVLVLFLILPPGFSAYLQVALNRVWEQELEPMPGQGPMPGRSAGPMPPKLDGDDLRPSI